MEIKYLVVPEVDPKKVSFSYQLFLDDFVRVCVTSDFRVRTSTKYCKRGRRQTANSQHGNILREAWT